MIAASEEFLEQIRPYAGSYIPDTDMRCCAIEAAAYLSEWGGHAYPPALAMRGLSIVLAVLAENSGSSWSVSKAKEMIAAGMPFVGWALDADNRRISGAPNPGEGDFTRYLPRER